MRLMFYALFGAFLVSGWHLATPKAGITLLLITAAVLTGPWARDQILKLKRRRRC